MIPFHPQVGPAMRCAWKLPHNEDVSLLTTFHVALMSASLETPIVDALRRYQHDGNKNENVDDH